MNLHKESTDPVSGQCFPHIVASTTYRSVLFPTREPFIVESKSPSSQVELSGLLHKSTESAKTPSRLAKPVTSELP